MVYQGSLPGTRSVRKDWDGLCAQNLGLLKCLNDMTQISSRSLDGKPAPEEMDWLSPESLALGNPASGQPRSWHWRLRLGVGDHDPVYEQTPPGHPGSTKQATKIQLPGPGALGPGIHPTETSGHGSATWVSLSPQINFLVHSFIHSGGCHMPNTPLRWGPWDWCHFPAVYGCTLQHGRPERSKCGWSKLRHARSVKYITDSKTLVPKKEYKIFHSYFLLYWAYTEMMIFGIDLVKENMFLKWISAASFYTSYCD